MSFELDNRVDGPVLPSDITLRVPLYRRQGIIASLVSALVALSANRRLRRASRRYRSGSSPPLPDYLRRDIGLPPLQRNPPSWNEIRW